MWSLLFRVTLAVGLGACQSPCWASSTSLADTIFNDFFAEEPHPRIQVLRTLLSETHGGRSLVLGFLGTLNEFPPKLPGDPQMRFYNKDVLAAHPRVRVGFFFARFFELKANAESSHWNEPFDHFRPLVEAIDVLLSEVYNQMIQVHTPMISEGFEKEWESTLGRMLTSQRAYWWVVNLMIQDSRYPESMALVNHDRCSRQLMGVQKPPSLDPIRMYPH